MVITPTIAGPMNPVTEARELDIPIIVDPYFGETSIAFTMNPLNANPKNATDTHMTATVPSDDTMYPEITKKMPDSIDP